VDFSNPYSTIEIPLIELIISLGIGVIVALIWAFVLSKSSRLIVDTSQYFPVFLILIPTMILIITIIKSSIALSLGLVGALSIVRFRTPIKEPEELLYIFVAIAVGLGLGANQIMPTLIGFLVIVLVLLPFNFSKNKVSASSYVIVDVVLNNPNFSMDDFYTILNESKLNFKIKRIHESDVSEITLQLNKLDVSKYEIFKNKLKTKYSNVEISMVDNSRLIT
jgi:hypothetical protein